MSTTRMPRFSSIGNAPARRSERRREGITLLLAIVAVMWMVEIINSLDSGQLDSEGIHPRDIGRLWGILTAPFLHAGFMHLIENTIPLVFMGAIVALRGAARLALVSAIVIVLGGLGTWLIAPAHSVTVGASGLVFGYATYLLTRGFFGRSALEVLTGLIVGIIWGGALIGSLIPHYGVSWQGHICGAVAGVLTAWLLAAERRPSRRAALPK